MKHSIIAEFADGDILNMYLYQEGQQSQQGFTDFSVINWGCVGEPIYFTPAKEGKYFIKVESYNFRNGHYTLRVYNYRVDYDGPVYSREK